MTDYIILRKKNPRVFELPEFYETGFFFNEAVHLSQQRNGVYHLLAALNQHTQQAEARCAFFVSSDEAVSPGAAPFGSVEFAESLPDIVLDEFLQALQDTVRTVDASTLRLVNYPNCYAPKQAQRLTNKLIEHGFRILTTDQNFFLPITGSDWESQIEPAERRRLRKCREAGFTFAHWQTPDLDVVIHFLQETRSLKGYPLTINPDQLRALLANFPNQFSVFVVRDGSRLAALTVSVRVRHDILYNFMPTYHPRYQTFSPMVMLTHGLFGYCQQQAIRLLDLGVSLDASRTPKPSLARFKKNLGAQESPKLVFEKSL
ncbi:GNAT family N-acetyltransferase [Spirosoma sp. SC4-14]|uniref:GNAT family N-acetyltransferase n=1 Tax=Spirosoma sp. SC4-14 TaxID=3128900 RepID=UPI0030D01389